MTDRDTEAAGALVTKMPAEDILPPALLTKMVFNCFFFDWDQFDLDNHAINLPFLFINNHTTSQVIPLEKH